MNTRILPNVILALAGLVLAGCMSTYYSAWETLGREKRDLLRGHVEDVRDSQEEAAESFTSALDRLRSLVDVDDEDLERTYDRLKGDYDEAAAAADDIHERIDDVETIARDLFAEWEGEIGEISDPELRRKSRAKLSDTRTHFTRLSASMRRAEASMAPVLTKLNDQVLYLKHNLNAAAIGGLDTEVGRIETDIDALIADMQASIAEADRFLAGLEN